jgi:hypothetical protein
MFATHFVRLMKYLNIAGKLRSERKLSIKPCIDASGVRQFIYPSLLIGLALKLPGLSTSNEELAIHRLLSNYCSASTYYNNQLDIQR